MLIALEILFLACVIVSVWRIMRNTFYINLLLILTLTAAAAAAYLVGLFAWAFFKQLPLNVLVAVSLSAALSMVVYLIVAHFLKDLVRLRFDQAGCRKRQSGWVGRFGNLLLSAVLVTSLMLIVSFLVELASASHLADTVTEQTLLLRYLVPPQEKTHHDASESDEQALADVMDEQTRFLKSFKSGIQRSKNKLAETVGTPNLVQQTRSLVTLLNLPPEDSAWLIEHTPELTVLQSNASVRAVMENDEVLDLIIQAGNGSISAVYRLSEHRAIIDLGNDRELAEALKVVDLVKLEALANAHRLSEEEGHVSTPQ